MIKLEHITKRYTAKLALDDVTVSIEEKGVVGLLGRNGAGKSTLMNILTGYIPSSGGSVLINDIDMEKEPQKAKRHLGYLPEQPPLYDTMTVAEYLSFVGRIKCMPKPEIPQKVDDICQRIGLVNEKDRLIRNLSKGYKQRVGIAQAMLGDPDFLILDEPTAGLDPMQIVEIRSVIQRFGRKHTVLISSHILSEIAEICDRVLIINDGRLVGDQRLSEVKQDMLQKSRMAIRITGSQEGVPGILRAVRGISDYKKLPRVEKGTSDWEVSYDGAKDSEDIRAELFDTVVENDRKLLLMSPIVDDIESIFLRLTASDVNNIQQ